MSDSARRLGCQRHHLSSGRTLAVADLGDQPMDPALAPPHRVTNQPRFWLTMDTSETAAVDAACDIVLHRDELLATPQTSPKLAK
jgi:hypothetical protein